MIVSFTTPGVLKVGLGTVAVAIAALTIKGSVLSRGQFVCDSVANPNCGLVYGTQGFDIPAYGASTATGGLAKYDTIRVGSPFDSTASARGLKTGTGVVRWLVLNVIASPSATTITCTKVAAKNTATGGTVLFSRATGTGTTYAYSTPFVMGPTEFIKCGTLNTPTAAYKASLLVGTTYSEVIN